MRHPYTLFKDLLLRNRLANQSEILCAASMGRGNDSLIAKSWSCVAKSGTHDQDQGGHALWKTGKTGKMINKNSLQGKIREFENFKKIREKSGNFENLVLIRCNL